MTNYQGIVSAQWLQANLTNPEVKIIDCRFRLQDSHWGYQQYLQSHIPGAYYLDLDRNLSSPVRQHGGRHPLPDPQVLARKLANVGIIAGKTMVVAYDDSRFAFAARLWWLLRYLGHDKAALLNGGWHGWRENNYPTTDIVPPSEPGSFPPEIATDWIVDLETVKQRKDLLSVVLVDAREGDRYRGEREPIDPIAGHIPGAVNLFWQEFTDSQSNIQPLSKQQQLWQPYQNAEEIILYCGSGVTACVNLFSLEMVKRKGCKLYPGGWSDWCSYLNKTE
jgi:thiosulfate/3-mercaptopyruvate sulfurtransferase